MHCSNCGNEIIEGNIFCIKCGEKVNKVDWANKKWITINKPQKDRKKNLIIIASIILFLCIGYIVSFKEKFLIHYAEEHMKYHEFDEVKNLLKFFITDNTNMNHEEEVLHGLYYFSTICSDINVTAHNIETANLEDFIIRYETNKAKLELYEESLPAQYRSVWYDMNQNYYFMKYEDFQREYLDDLEYEIIGEILNELYEIYVNEKAYSIAELKRLQKEKETLFDEITKMQEEKVNSIRKYYYGDYYSDALFESFVEHAEEIIGELEEQIIKDEEYLKEKFVDYSEESQYVSSSETKESLIIKNGIEADYIRLEIPKRIFESDVDELSKVSQQVQADFIMSLFDELEYAYNFGWDIPEEELDVGEVVTEGHENE